MVPGVAFVARQPEARLVRLGGSEAGRLAPEQLGQQLLRLRLDARRADRPVLPAELPPRAGRPQLVERRGPGRVRSDPAVLVRPRRGRVPHRRRAHGHQGPRAAGQPAGRARRTDPRAAARPAVRLQREPARGARRAPPVPGHRRLLRPAPHAGGRDVHAPDRRRDPVLRERRRAQPGVQHPVRAGAARGPRAAGSDRAHRGADARGLHSGVDGQQPRRAALPDPLGGERPGAGARAR